MTREKDLQGAIAVEVAHTVADPIRALRDRLGLVVDHLERHVATSTGPTPYPWRSLQTLRQDLASAYLEVTHLARRLEELDGALYGGAIAPFDLGATVDLGLRLAGHHLGPGIECLIDLGQTAPVSGVAATFALVIAQLVGVCARSARAVAGSSLSVRVWTDEGVPAVMLADNGAGDPAIEDTCELARAVIAPWGATLDAASATGQGCTFEIRWGA